MAPHKTLINRTGHPLDVTLIVRKGDHPTETAESVDVQLPPGPDDDGMRPEERSVQTVTYGNSVNIYLNGLELTFAADGQRRSIRRVVAERGKPLDNALNMFDTIEFRFDGEEVLFTSSNAAQKQQVWKLTPVP
jgi:hypothetical protein